MCGLTPTNLDYVATSIRDAILSVPDTHPVHPPNAVSPSSTPPIKVVVTGAAGQISYSLLYMIASGCVFGENQPIILHLLDIAPMMEVLHGVVMELQDSALRLVKDVIATDDACVAFKDIDAAFMVGAMPRREGMERKDLLAANVKIFKVQGQAMDKFAKKSVRVLVVGNPANTNALIISHYAPSIPKENISAMTRLDHNRLAAQVALKTGCKVEDVRKVTIWGNHSSTQYPDITHCTIRGQSIGDMIKDDNWIKENLVPTVQSRGAAVIAARKLSSAMSAAKAACDHMKSWWQGTQPGDWVSMAVFSDGSYNTPHGVMFSFPVTCTGGKWTIVKVIILIIIFLICNTQYIDHYIPCNTHYKGYHIHNITHHMDHYIPSKTHHIDNYNRNNTHHIDNYFSSNIHHIDYYNLSNIHSTYHYYPSNTHLNNHILHNTHYRHH